MISMCANTHTYSNWTEINHGSFSKRHLHPKNKKFNFVQLKLILQLNEYTSNFSKFYQKRKENQKEISSWHQWLIPVILATWEAEIRRSAVPGQPRQTVCKTPPSPK
jgi:hypothetical protein